MYFKWETDCTEHRCLSWSWPVNVFIFLPLSTIAKLVSFTPTHTHILVYVTGNVMAQTVTFCEKNIHSCMVAVRKRDCDCAGSCLIILPWWQCMFSVTNLCISHDLQMFESVKVESTVGPSLLSTNDSIHHIPRPQMRADTQTFTERSFLLLPGLRPYRFEPNPAGEDRKLTGLHWLGLLGATDTRG